MPLRNLYQLDKGDKMIILGISIDLGNLMYIMMVAVVLWVLYLFNTHRISVESMHRVNEGFVNKTGRYKKVIDKETSLEYLKPMLGKYWLPKAPEKAFQKVNGQPIMGALRSIVYLFPGSLPCSALLPDGSLYNFNIRRWLYMKERHKMLKKNKKKEIMVFLNLYLPVMIITGSIIFFTLIVALEIKLNWSLSSKFDEIANLIINIYGGKNG